MSEENATALAEPEPAVLPEAPQGLPTDATQALPTDATQVLPTNATQSAPVDTRPAAETTERAENVPPGWDEFPVVPGLEAPALEWWTAVHQVHELLLRGGGNLDEVSAVYANELRARWEYAKALHENGYQVPDYLAERATVAPVWPLPHPPVRARRVPRAA